MLVASLILIPREMSIRTDCASVILAATREVWPDAMPAGQIDVVDCVYVFRIDGPFFKNPLVDYRKPMIMTKWQKNWGFRSALNLWRANIIQSDNWSEKRRILDKAISNTKNQRGSWGEVPGLSALNFGATTMVCSMKSLHNLNGGSSFMNSHSIQALNGKDRKVNRIIRTWKPCFSADGKYAFTAISAVWSIIHEARIAFLFERTTHGWKLILRQDSKMV